MFLECGKVLFGKQQRAHDEDQVLCLLISEIPRELVLQLAAELGKPCCPEINAALLNFLKVGRVEFTCITSQYGQ
ncbi:hypothetical protein SDC9_99768 [bioreactor metagenome]|uniref:Uncharacterized protein n=1 Tax=bioreactor metagenome TaxID=1076179 RepID=A0A645ATV3_9ZZZZ